MLKPEAHRPGLLKQQNKSHKHGRHRTKRRIDSETKGRVSVKHERQKAKRNLSKHDRRNQTKQLRNLQRSEILERKRSLGQGDSPPFLTAVLSLCEDVDSDSVLGRILTSAEDHVATSCDRHVTFLCVPRFKQRFSFVIPPQENLYAMLDVLKVADSVVLIWPLSGELSEFAENLLTCIFAQGVPACVHVVPGFLSLSSKKKEKCKKSVNKLLEKWSFEPKFLTCDSESDGLTLLRQIGCAKRRRLVLQERRPHILVESVEPLSYDDESFCTLKAYGYIRGPPLDVNGLIHVPGFGDFQMKQIDLCPDPYPLQQKQMMEEGAKVLATPDSAKQESLQSEVAPDHMDGEQTWPTEEELAEAECLAGSRKKVIKKVPKGTSDYQATWILDEEEEEITSSDSSDDDETGDLVDEAVSVDDEIEDEEMDVEDLDTVSVSSHMDTDRYDEKIDLTDEKLQLEKFRKQRENEMFPDEIDTPLDVLARIRFQKYNKSLFASK